MKNYSVSKTQLYTPILSHKNNMKTTEIGIEWIALEFAELNNDNHHAG